MMNQIKINHRKLKKKILRISKKFNELHLFQKEIILNMFKIKYSRDYSLDSKKFSLILYVKSPRCYQLAEIIIPLPCYKTFQNTFRDDLSKYKNAILDVKNLPILLKEKESLYSKSEIPFVLAIDAFTTTIFKKKEIKDNNRYCFIFQLQPFHHSVKCFIEHLKPYYKGNAAKEIDEIIQEILKIPTKFKIYFISVDGDLHYDAFFKKQFDRLFSRYRENDLSDIFKHLFDFGPIFISDFLHILKNLRSRLLNNKCIINPLIKQKKN